MSLFSKIFGDAENSNTQSSKVHWEMLTEMDQLAKISEESASAPQIIFKHSTRCSISRMALKQFESHYTLKDVDATLYFLDLLEYRQISNAIAGNFNVVHQSPQLLLIHKGECVYTTSHSEIDAEELATKIKSLN